MRGGWGRKGRERGSGTAGSVMLTGLLVVRNVFLEVKCFELCFSLHVIVLCDVAGLKCLAILSEGMTPEADGTVRLILG